MLAKQIKKYDGIEKFKGIEKARFTIPLNVALDNYYRMGGAEGCKGERVSHEEAHKKLLDVLFSRRGLDDEIKREFKKYLKACSENKPCVYKMLKDLRNYFSHFYHKDRCLAIDETCETREFIEEAWKYARERVNSSSNVEDVQWPELVEDGVITPAGVIFFASFFSHRGDIERLIGCVRDFMLPKADGNPRKEEREKLKLIRKALSFYSLKDSFSITGQNPDAIVFRDIVGYLDKVPIEFAVVEKNAEGKKDDDSRYGDKFALFAMQFIEDHFERLKREYGVCFAKVVYKSFKSEDERKKNKEGKKIREIVFSVAKKLNDKTNDKKKDDEEAKEHYYLRKNNAIIRILKNDGKAETARLGVNELRYLVYLCLCGQGDAGAKALYDYIQENKKIIIDGPVESGSKCRALPAFAKGKVGSKVDLKRASDRVEKILGEWKSRKEKVAEEKLGEWKVAKHEKVRDVLRCVNDSMGEGSRALNASEYNELRDWLIEGGDKFGEFLSKLAQIEARGNS